MDVWGAPSDFNSVLDKQRNNPKITEQQAEVQCACMLIFIKLYLKTHKGKQEEHEAASFGRGRCLNPLY